MQEYLEGTNFELYVTALPPALEGLAFHEARFPFLCFCVVFCFLSCWFWLSRRSPAPLVHTYALRTSINTRA